MIATNDQVQQKLASMSTKPGVYLFKDAKGAVLYVGKAKSLRLRVRSYFRPKATLEPAKQEMIKRVAALETIVVDTENEALILEASLIRRYQPPYNVVLRDDKYYLFIKITKEEYPRVYPVRRITKDNAKYFGPYSSAASVRRTLKLLRRIFPYHEEKESPREKIFPHPLFTQSVKSSPHSLRSAERSEGGRPPSPSAVELSETAYQENINHIIRFLKGEREEISTTLRRGMQAAAAAKNFERAAIWRDQLHYLERLEGNQKVFLAKPESFDVVSIGSNNMSAANVLQIRQGKLLGQQTFLLRHRPRTPAADILRYFLLQYYREAQDIPTRILIPEALSDSAQIAAAINQANSPQFVVPRRGQKKQLLTMGLLNAQQLLLTEQAAFTVDARLKRASAELAIALSLPDPLNRIETYDISNVQGKHATGSMVVFTAGVPDKSQYRKFRITSLDTPDDFRMLQEVLTRRLTHLAKDKTAERWAKPDLILIDGGKGQLSAANKILQDLKLSIPIAALAKQEEELFIPGKTASIKLPYDSDALYLVQRMRDEAHRFVITYHRLLRSKQASRSLLDEIPGIGPKLKKKLLARFGSLKNIRAASDQELTQVVGPGAIKSLRDFI